MSRKFNIAELRGELAKYQLKLVKNWTDPKQWFGVLLFQKS
ncbi:MAG: L-histidine N(alpha)-methyltransferase [Microcystaceae cyanobacterium]